jgi:microcystin-dependent protein
VEIPATSSNIPGTLVLRDASGNLSAGVVTADVTGDLIGGVTGNASTATALQTSRTFELTGDVTGSASFNGTSNASITASIGSGVIVDADINSSAGIVSTKLSAATQESLVPVGAVMPFAMNSAPTGWLSADGSNVSRTTYANLFTAIGTTYGAGDGSTTFALPDLRGIFVRGSGSQTISGTAYSGTFAVKAADDLKAHTHDVSDTSFSATPLTGGATPVNVVAGGVTRTTSSTGGTETRPANIALLYCIKF